MTEPEGMKPFLEAVQRLTDRMVYGHGLEQTHIFDPDAPAGVPPSAASLRARTVAPRIITGGADEPEVFIPMNDSPRSRAVLQRLLDGPTSEERKRWGREAAGKYAECRQALAENIDRHAGLVVEHVGQRLVTVLLEEHGPHLVEVGGKQYAECHGCPTYWEHSEDEDEEWHEEYHAWPCHTWTTIAEQTEGKL